MTHCPSVIPAPLPVIPAQAGISHPSAASRTTIPQPLYRPLRERSGKAPHPTRILEARD